MKLAPISAALALAWPGWALAYDVGPAVGTRAPALHAIDVTGRPVKLADLSGRNGVVLMFFRSAKWCPFCQKQLIEFQAAQAPLAARGYRLVALSYDSPEVTIGFAEKQKLSYQFLSDPGSVTIDTYKLRDEQYKPGGFAYGVPHPVIFIISPKGMIQVKLADEGYQVRPSVQAVLDAVDKIRR